MDHSHTEDTESTEIDKASPPDKSQRIGPNEFKYTVQWAEPHCYMIAPSGLFLTFSLSHCLTVSHSAQWAEPHCYRDRPFRAIF